MSSPSIQIHHYQATAADWTLEIDSPILSSDEAVRAARFINERHKVIYIAIHRFLRLKLAEHLAIEPAAITFGLGEYGKPFIAHPGGTNIHFSLSHRGEHAILAISDHEVGIDIEQLRPIDDVDAFCSIYFHPNERAIIDAVSVAEQSNTIFTFWAFKEAFIKALGIGFSRDLTEFDLSLFYSSPIHSLSFLDNKTFSIHRVQVIDGHVGAVAFEVLG